MRRALVIALLVFAAAPAAAQAELRTEPTVIRFPETVLGDTTQPIPITVRATCFPFSTGCFFADPASIDVTVDVFLGNGEVTQTNDCPATLPGDSLAGSTCTILARFKPTDFGESYARLFVGHSNLGPMTPVYVTLIGYGIYAPPAEVNTKPVSRKRCEKKRQRAKPKKCRKKKARSA